MDREKKYNRFTLPNKASLIHSGRPYFETLVLLIDSAKKEIHLQVYIFEADETGIVIRDALIRAAGRGVQVFLLLDGFGSGSLPSRFIHHMDTAGIHLRWFGPLFSGMRLHLGRRMHYKVFVADGRTSLVGGINIGNRYNELHGNPPWLDFAVLCEGEIAFRLEAFCIKKWRGFSLPGRQKVKKMMDGPPALPDNTCPIRIRVNDRLRRKARIVYSYRETIRRAKEDIVIVGAYFIPGRTFSRLMNKASSRGVKIRLITGTQSDVWLAKYALRYLYSRLLRSNIEIYEYKKAPVHGKAIVADRKFVSLGSYDLNQLSTFINLELNLDINDDRFAGIFHDVLEKIIKNDCILVTAEMVKQRQDYFTMFKQWLAYRILRVLFFITLFVSNKNGS